MQLLRFAGGAQLLVCALARPPTSTLGLDRGFGSAVRLRRVNRGAYQRTAPSRLPGQLESRISWCRGATKFWEMCAFGTASCTMRQAARGTGLRGADGRAMSAHEECTICGCTTAAARQYWDWIWAVTRWLQLGDTRMGAWRGRGGRSYQTGTAGIGSRRSRDRYRASSLIRWNRWERAASSTRCRIVDAVGVRQKVDDEMECGSILRSWDRRSVARDIAVVGMRAVA